MEIISTFMDICEPILFLWLPLEKKTHRLGGALRMVSKLHICEFISFSQLPLVKRLVRESLFFILIRDGSVMYPTPGSIRR